jgi:hypothetical protein
MIYGDKRTNTKAMQRFEHDRRSFGPSSML